MDGSVMTIKVKYHNGVFEPLTAMEDIELEEGAELEIQLPGKNRKTKLQNIIGLFSDLTDQQLRKYEDAAMS